MRRTALILSAVFAFAGCTLPGGGQASAPATPSATAQPPTTGSTAQPTTGSTAQSTPEPVLASRTTSYNGKKAIVDLNQIVVTGDVTTVTWTLTNPSAKDSIEVIGGLYKDTNIFSDGLSATVPGSDAEVEFDLRAADGVYLIDTVNKRRYLAARDTAGVCMCSSPARWEQLKPGASMPFSATYRAIPVGVDTVNVSVPGAGTFVKVPVQR